MLRPSWCQRDQDRPASINSELPGIARDESIAFEAPIPRKRQDIRFTLALQRHVSDFPSVAHQGDVELEHTHLGDPDVGESQFETLRPQHFVQIERPETCWDREISREAPAALA